MKTFVAVALAFTAGTNALVSRANTCCFSLTASGGASGTVGQLPDGQARIGGSLPAGSFCIDSNGGITDGAGRGCFLTPPTTQFQCDANMTPVNGFTVGCDGQLSFNGNSQFFQCPTGQDGQANIYMTAPAGQQGCSAIHLMASSCKPNTCQSQSQSQMQSQTPSQMQTKTQVETQKQTETQVQTQKQTETQVQTQKQTETQVQTQKQTEMQTKTETQKQTEVQTKTQTAVQTQTQVQTQKQTETQVQTQVQVQTQKQTEVQTQVQVQTQKQTEVQTQVQVQTQKQTEVQTVTQTVKQTVTQTVVQTQAAAVCSCPQAPAQPQSQAPSQTPSQAPAPTPSQTPAQKQCPTNLSGNFEFPHLIIPVNSASPNQAAGTSLNGQVSSTISSIFNFDIPPSDAGMTCSLVFLFPKQSDLVTSSFTFSGNGGIDFSLLSSAANAQTTFANEPKIAQEFGVTTVAPGNSYNIASFPCPAGQTVAFELQASGNTNLNYFQDFNPAPIGLFITVC